MLQSILHQFLLLSSNFKPTVQFNNDATQPVWRQKLSTTPVFHDHFERVEGPAAKAKEMSNGAEQVIVFEWRAQDQCQHMLDEEKTQFLGAAH